MDVLSDVLRVIRLTGSIFYTAHLSDPFSIISPSAEVILRYMPGKAECISLFHIITEGKCWFRTETGIIFPLMKGSVAIFPQGCSHTMYSRLDAPPVHLLRILNPEQVGGLSTLEYGGHGEKTQFICGYLLCDQRFNPLLGTVPDVLILSSESEEKTLKEEDNHRIRANTLPILPGSWLDITLRQLVDEVRSDEYGSATIITRLTELIYIEVLRRYMNALPEKSNGWLAAVRDHEIGVALKYLHAHPEEKWNVEMLASRVGVSRSAFARRFTDLIGESPIRYLTGWRMQLAQRFLLQPDLSMAMVAEKIGYDSDITFNRAFKRYVGEPPAHWRDRMIMQAQA